MLKLVIVQAPHLTYTLVRCSAPAVRTATSLPGCPPAGRCLPHQAQAVPSPKLCPPHQAVQRFAFISVQLGPQTGKYAKFRYSCTAKRLFYRTAHLNFQQGTAMTRITCLEAYMNVQHAKDTTEQPSNGGARCRFRMSG